MTVGERIKDYADSNGIKNRFLAEKAGISDSKMSKILSGKRKINVIEYYCICQALDVPMEYFMEE